MATTKELFSNIVEQIIGMMESENLEWSKPFKSLRHQNPVSGTVYRGINPFILSLKAVEKGWTSNLWMTFNQAKKAGLMVKKGAKSTPVFFFSIVEKENEDGKVETFPIFKSYRVFNQEQLDGVFKIPKGVELIKTEVDFSDEKLDVFIKNTKANIKTDPTSAYYSLSRDYIGMPPQANFVSKEGYYATLLHELSHWTGHKSRLNRESLVQDSPEHYAFEELVAELSATFLCSELGVEKGGVDQNHAAYLKSWIAALKENPMVLWKAASQAQKSFDYLLELQK